MATPRGWLPAKNLLHQAMDDKSLFMFYENWRSMEDREKHREMPHLKAFRQKADSLLAKPIEVTLFGMISQTDLLQF
jgi:quinol monooxygenase YgiN